MNKNQDIQAVLLRGAIGLGIWEALYDAARAALCEAPVAAASLQLGVWQDVGLKACGHCAACRLMAAGTHPDLMVLVPDALLPELGVGTQESTEVPVASEKRAPSREIGIDAIRGLVEWAHPCADPGVGGSAVCRGAAGPLVCAVARFLAVVRRGGLADVQLWRARRRSTLAVGVVAIAMGSCHGDGARAAVAVWSTVNGVAAGNAMASSG